MSEKRALTDVLKPMCQLFGEFFKRYNELMTEIDAYLKTIPDEELTPPKIEAFVDQLTEGVLKILPTEGPLSQMRPVMPDVVRSNFYAGMRWRMQQQKRRKEKS